MIRRSRRRTACASCVVCISFVHQYENINAVTVDELRSIDPKLSATAITISITLRWTTTMTDTEVRNRLAEIPGLESIKRIG